MATGNIILTPGMANLPDATTSNLAPSMQKVKSSATAPGIYFMQLAFDAAADEWCTFVFRMPDDFDSSVAPVAKVQYKMTSATSGAVQWDVRLGTVAAGAAVDVDAKGFATANTTNSTVSGTVGRMVEASITLTNYDSALAGDFSVVRLARNGSNGSDTATGDAEFIAMTIAYTTL